MELCSSPQARLEARLFCMGAEEVARQPLPSGWEIIENEDGAVSYLKLATDECFDASPAQKVYDEVRHYCRDALAETDMGSRIALASKHLSEFREQAEKDMHSPNGKHSTEALEEESKAELHYRRRLLCILLRLEASALPSLQWSSGKAIDEPTEKSIQLRSNERVWKKPNHRLLSIHAETSRDDKKVDSLPVKASAKKQISCRRTGLYLLFFIVVSNLLMLAFLNSVMTDVGSGTHLDMWNTLRSAAHVDWLNWRSSEEVLLERNQTIEVQKPKPSESETSNTPKVKNMVAVGDTPKVNKPVPNVTTTNRSSTTPTQKPLSSMFQNMPSAKPTPKPRRKVTLFPLVRTMDFEGNGSLRLDPSVKVHVDPTRFSQPGWLQRCFSRAQLRLREFAAKAKTGDYLLKAIKVVFPSSMTELDTLSEATDWYYSITCEPDSQALASQEAKTATCVIRSQGVFGTIAALQSTLIQLFFETGVAPVSKIRITDWPVFPIRGMMIDMGRRFVPKDVILHQIIDAMALFRMNLLHLHLNDFCRFAIDLPGFPELNKSLHGISEGQYSLSEIQEIVEYARERGVMVLPEIDLPGHASGLLPLEGRGMEFCKPKLGAQTRPEEAAKAYDDPQGKTRKVLKELIKETFHVFNASSVLNWFHVGGDEANPHGNCTTENIVKLESFLVSDVVRKKLGATAVAWEELRLKTPEEHGFRAAGNTTSTIIIPWHLGNAQELMNKGHRAIAAYTINHYLDFDYRQSPVEMFWYNISAPRKGSPPAGAPYVCNNVTYRMHNDTFLGELAGSSKEFLLEDAKMECARLEACLGVTCGTKPKTCQPRRGTPYLAPSPNGEISYTRNCTGNKKPADRPSRAPMDYRDEKLLGAISPMWTDNYCYKYQCGAADRKWGVPRGAVMYLRSYDTAFRKSLGGMMFPRAAISAGSMWNYKPGLAPDFIRNLAKWASSFLARVGIASCPPGCTCDEVSSCGRPYSLPLEAPGFNVNSTKQLRRCYKKSDVKKSLSHFGPLASDISFNELFEALLYCFWMGPHCVAVGKQPSKYEIYRIFAPPYRGDRNLVPDALFLKRMTADYRHCEPVNNFGQLVSEATAGTTITTTIGYAASQSNEDGNEESKLDADGVTDLEMSVESRRSAMKRMVANGINNAGLANLANMFKKSETLPDALPSLAA